jgi:agmatinase
VREACQKASRIVIDIDCDVFDPAFFPGSAHPLPFGLSPQTLLRFLDAAWSEKVIGLAISEFDPARDVRDQSLATLVWLLEYVLLRKYES